jgi:hypothetical protein
MDSIRLVLQPGLIDDSERLSLWKKSARKPAYLVGFLRALPDDLPDPAPARDDASANVRVLGTLAGAGNPCASLLMRVLSSPGQTFLNTLSRVLAKPPTQDVIHAALDLVRDYFSPLRPEGDPDLSLAELLDDAPAHAPESVRACREAVPGLGGEIAAMRLLSGVGYGVLRPVLGGSTAVGSLMRRKLRPVTDALLRQIEVLQGKGA